jgi:ACR3 family arsenite efflux pump ArsB
VACVVAAAVALTTAVSGGDADAVGAIAVELPILVMCVNIVRAVHARYVRRHLREEAAPLVPRQQDGLTFP